MTDLNIAVHLHLDASTLDLLHLLKQLGVKAPPAKISTPDPYDGQYPAEDVALAEHLNRNVIDPGVERTTALMSEARRRDHDRDRLDHVPAAGHFDPL